MTLTYRYKSLSRPNGTSVKSPVIPITLNGKSKTGIDVIALIDSGADLSVIPEDIADLLDLDLKKEEVSTANGIGGKVDVKNTKIRIQIGNPREHYELIIPVQVVLGKSDIPPLLGRAGFFDEFKITFQQKKFNLSLKKEVLRNY